MESEGNWKWVMGADFTRTHFKTQFSRSCVRQNAGFSGVRPHSGECSYGFEIRSNQNWAQNEPSNSGGGEHTIEMWANGQWSDEPADHRQAFIREWDR